MTRRRIAIYTCRIYGRKPRFTLPTVSVTYSPIHVFFAGVLSSFTTSTGYWCPLPNQRQRHHLRTLRLRSPLSATATLNSTTIFNPTTALNSTSFFCTRNKTKKQRFNTSSTMTTNASGLAFRISNLPKEITGHQLLQILNHLHLDISSDGEFDNENVLGWSLASAAASADTGRVSTATVTFKSLPTVFQFAGASKSISLVPNTPPVNVDKHFYGFTPLSDPSHPIIE